MRDSDKDLHPAPSAPEANVQPTKQASFERLTKAQIIELLRGNIHRPLTPEGLYRCAASIVGKWCEDVIGGEEASLQELTQKLETLEDIYRHR